MDPNMNISKGMPPAYPTAPDHPTPYPYGVPNSHYPPPAPVHHQPPPVHYQPPPQVPQHHHYHAPAPVQPAPAPAPAPAAAPQVTNVVNQVMAPSMIAAAPAPTTVVVQGNQPNKSGTNHLLHAIITFFFFPWIVVWICICIYDSCKSDPSPVVLGGGVTVIR